MFYSKSLQDTSTQRIQVTSWLAEIWQVTWAKVMAIRLSASSKDTRGLEGNSNAKPIITPHWGSTVMVRQTRKWNNRELGRSRQAIHRQFQVNIQKTRINWGTQSLHPKIRGDTPLIHTMLEYNQKFSRRRLWRASNWCLYIRALSERLRQRHGSDKTKNNSRTHGSGK
jgi:hypothetical protein